MENPTAPGKLELLWTIEQVAQYFGVRKSTVWRWIKLERVFDKTKLVYLNGRIRVPRSEVERAAGARKEEILSNIN